MKSTSGVRAIIVKGEYLGHTVLFYRGRGEMGRSRLCAGAVSMVVRPRSLLSLTYQAAGERWGCGRREP